MNQDFRKWWNYRNDYTHPFWKNEYNKFMVLMTDEKSPLFKEVSFSNKEYCNNEVVELINDIRELPGGDFLEYKGLELLEDMKKYDDVYRYFISIYNVYNSLNKLSLIGLHTCNLLHDASNEYRDLDVFKKQINDLSELL